MTNKDIEDMKNRIDELAKIAKDKENENAVLKQQVKTQREKIDSLLKELEEEKGKTIVVSDGMITMRADMWEALNENMELKAENKALKQRIKDLEDVLDSKYYTAEESELNKLIVELQDQHQQDCIRYTDMRIAYLVTLDELAKLREQFGVGR